MFHPNLGRADRGIRLVGGATLLGLGVMGATYVGLIGLYPLITAFIARDPLYAALHTDTRFDDPDDGTEHINPAESDGPSGGISMAIATVTGGTLRS